MKHEREGLPAEAGEQEEVRRQLPAGVRQVQQAPEVQGTPQAHHGLRRVSKTMERAMKYIGKISDSEVHETENGVEYAAMPVHHPAVPGSSPHGWMGVVNGHIIGVMLTSYDAALIQAEGVANMSARN